MAMKYRQRGYRDGDYRDERESRVNGDDRPALPRALSPEQRSQIRSLRHATDREAREVVRCATCGRNVEHFGAITRESHCPHCSAALHCCRTCTHFDTGARWECRKPVEVRVESKGTANDCSSFEPRLVLDATGRRSGGSARGPSDPKAAFENLFKR